MKTLMSEDCSSNKLKKLANHYKNESETFYANKSTQEVFKVFKYQ